MKRIIGLLVAAMAMAAGAYLPPVEEKNGVRVEIESFPQKTERPKGSPYAWPLGVTEVVAAQSGATSRPFTVTVENKTERTVTGQLEVWMNDDWAIDGPDATGNAKLAKVETGRVEVSIAPNAKRSFAFTGTAKPSALSALYPVHARFTPAGAKAEAALHPIAVFMFKHPKAPRVVAKARPPRLGKGEFELVDGFVRTVWVKVGDKVEQIADNGRSDDWGGYMLIERTGPDGGRRGFSTHPPYKKGAGFVWSDFTLELPAMTPIRFSCANYINSNHGQPLAPHSDGVEYKVFVREAGEGEWKEVCGQFIAEPRKWQAMAGDLSAYAGKKVELRLWTGPGAKMNTCCDSGGWGDVRLAIGETFSRQDTEAEWQERERRAVAAARQLLGKHEVGMGVARGPKGLVDGVIAFTDGERVVTFRGFRVQVERGDAETVVEPKGTVEIVGDALQVRWELPGVTPNAHGFPRIADIAIGPANVRPVRVYAGFGNVIENVKRMDLGAGGFGLSTRHVGADYANGLSVVQAVDVPPDRVIADGERNLFALHAHHNAKFTFTSSAKGAFRAARKFRAVAGYRASAGHERLGSRMCLDQWGGDYAKGAKAIALAAKYGVNDAIFVKHVWQRWGYDYRLPEIYPPEGNAAAFGDLREACRKAGILFCPHDNYTDIYPDCDGYSYDLVVFNLDGTPQRAWFNPGRHALSYRWAPHAFRPWCLRNAKLLQAGYDPDAIFIDVLTAHAPFDYLDRKGGFHSKVETSRHWAKAYETYREGYGKSDAVCVSEAGQDHLVGVLDAGESDHFGAAKLVGAKNFGDAERTPWHDIVTHNYFVLFAGGLGGRYQEEQWHSGGDAKLHGYASDDYLSNCIIGGRNPMCDGPFSRNAVKTYWLQHDACAELGRMEFLDLQYEGNIHRQHSWFDKGEVWVNRATNAVWKLSNGLTLPSYGYYAKTPTTESGILERDGMRYAFAKSPNAFFVDARNHRAVDFGGVVTDGSFRLVGKEIIPLPGSEAFSATIDLSLLGAKGKRIAKVVSVEPQEGAKSPEWKQQGDQLSIRVDAHAFAYRVVVE